MPVNFILLRGKASEQKEGLSSYKFGTAAAKNNKIKLLNVLIYKHHQKHACSRVTEAMMYIRCLEIKKNKQ